MDYGTDRQRPPRGQAVPPQVQSMTVPQMQGAQQQQRPGQPGVVTGGAGGAGGAVGPGSRSSTGSIPFAIPEDAAYGGPAYKRTSYDAIPSWGASSGGGLGVPASGHMGGQVGQMGGQVGQMGGQVTGQMGGQMPHGHGHGHGQMNTGQNTTRGARVHGTTTPGSLMHDGTPPTTPRGGAMRRADGHWSTPSPKAMAAVPTGPSLYAAASPRPPQMVGTAVTPSAMPPGTPGSAARTPMRGVSSTGGGGGGGGAGGAGGMIRGHQHSHSHGGALGAGHARMSPSFSVQGLPPAAFRLVHSRSELHPVSNPQPSYRRALPEGGFVSPLNALTTQLTATYQICNPLFSYQSSKNPRRVLTKPSEPKLNNGYDNAESDYLLYVNDILGAAENRRYLVLDILGQGTFGQVVKCQNMMTKEIVAVKVIKNKPAYLNQSMMEVSILEHLNNKIDRHDQHNLLRLKDKFVHREHLCLVFELLSSNLYELIKQNEFRGLSTNLVRVFARQLLDSLMVLKEARLIHCDLKPENILLKSLDSPVIKVIDFGSACHEQRTVYTYIQSRFYRSPEVILGLPYTSSIDMWSLGCIVAELFLGLPIFPGTSEYNQLSRIVETLGTPPNWMIEMGKNSGQFMEKHVDEFGRKNYRLKSREKYSREYNADEQPSKMYFSSTNLHDIIMSYPLPRRSMTDDEVEHEMQNRLAFVDFVRGLLNLNPFERWTPHQAAGHPFITEQPFKGPYVPTALTVAPRVSDQKRAGPAGPAPATGPGQQGPPKMRAGPSGAVQPSPQAPQGQGHTPTMGTTTTTAAGQPPTYYNGRALQVPGAGENAYANAHHLAPPVPAGPPMATNRGGGQTMRRARATTIGQLDSIPAPIQRATALVDPAQPIRAQPSPAYIPPPDVYQNSLYGGVQPHPHHPQAAKHGGAPHGHTYHPQNPSGTGSSSRGSNDVIRNLEDGLYMSH